jgi:predicted Fe-Mo cluster-binding NifX family protein
MDQKILSTVYVAPVAPRVDLAAEVSIVSMADDGRPIEKKTVVLPRASAEQLCHLVLLEKIGTVVCGGIEDEYYQYLKWKNVKVLDSVIGTIKELIKRLESGTLQ